MNLGGYNFFEMVNAPAYLSGYTNVKALQSQIKIFLMDRHCYTGLEIALCCQDDYFWFILSNEGDDPSIRFYSEAKEKIEIKFDSLSKMVNAMIEGFKKFYNIQS